jgi:galactokinase
MFGRLFRDHPRSLGMSWAEHGEGAVVIGARMVGAGFACMIHAAVPALFTETAGRTIMSLHDHMVRRKAGAANPNAWPDYEI